MQTKIVTIIVAMAMLAPVSSFAGGDQIASAESAGPASLSKQATVKDWDMKVLRKGTNGWTCLPDNPKTAGTDPWCMNEAWLGFLDALANKKKPTYSQMGVAYMLQGDTAVSNTDPYATAAKPGDDWVEGLKAHLMILLPDRSLLKQFPTKSTNGGPWVMWPDTPYAHLMLPIDSYPATK